MLKNISCILVMVLILTSIAPFVYANDSVSVNEGYSEIVEFLRVMEIIPEKDLAASSLTRAEFASYTARVLGINDFEQTNTRYYIDVPMDHYALSGINGLLERKVLTMGESKMFRPSELITYEEACKMLVSAIGCGDYAEVNGGFPAGYIKGARQNGISSGIVNDGEFTTEEALRMLYNTLNAEIYDYVSISTDGSYHKEKSETVLSAYHKVYYDEGTVISIDGESIYADKLASEGEALIGDTRCIVGDEIQSDILGNFVEYYYTENEKDQRDIVYLTVGSSKPEITIDIKDVSAIGVSSVKYWEENREKTVSLSGTSVVYNGAALSMDITQTLGQINYGDVVIKDRDDDGIYDFILINDYTDFYLTAKNDAELTISDNKMTKSRIELENYDIFKFFDVAGKRLEITDLTLNTVLSVRRSKDGEVFTAVVSDMSKTGVLERIKNKDGEIVYTIGGTECVVNKAYHQSISKSVAIGGKYTFRMNFKGEIVFATLPDTEQMVSGYIVAGAIKEDVFEKKIIFKIYTENGELKEFECSDRIVIDGKRYTSPETAFAAFPDPDTGDEKFTPQLILYKATDNVIKAIDTYKLNPDYEDERYTLQRRVGAWDEKQYVSGTIGRFGRDIIVSNTATTLYNVPGNEDAAGAAEKKFSVGAASFVTGNNMYAALDFYRLGTSQTYYNYVVNFNTVVPISNDSYICLITEIYQTMNDDGEVVTEFEGLMQDAKVKYELDLDETVGGLAESEYTKGDIVRFAARGNVVVNMERLYDYENGGVIAGPPTYWQGYGSGIGVQGVDAGWYDDPKLGYSLAFQLSFGYVNSIDENIIKFGYFSGDQQHEFCVNYSNIMIYDRETDEAYIGTVDDILTYDTVGSTDKCSRLVWQTVWAKHRSLVVYR